MGRGVGGGGVRQCEGGFYVAHATVKCGRKVSCRK